MKRILIVDDNKEDLKMMQDALSKQDYLIDTVSTAREAADALLDKQYDLFLLDIKLEKTDGNYIAKRIRTNFGFEPKIIYVSLKPKTKLTSQELAHANGFIQKPFSKEEFLEEMKKFN